MTKYHPNSIISPINKHLTEEEVTPYHVMAYNIHIDPDENMAIPPTPCPKRDGNMVRNTKIRNDQLRNRYVLIKYVIDTK